MGDIGNGYLKRKKEKIDLASGSFRCFRSLFDQKPLLFGQWNKAKAESAGIFSLDSLVTATIYLYFVRSSV